MTTDNSSNISSRIEATGKKAKSIFLRILLFGTLLALIGGAIYVYAMGWEYSAGNRAGYLLKISERGYIFKTYEGQLSVGPLGNFNPLASGNVWEFSAANQQVYSQLQKHEGKYVTLHYRQIYKNFPWQGDTPYMVDSVELVSTPR